MKTEITNVHVSVYGLKLPFVDNSAVELNSNLTSDNFRKKPGWVSAIALICAVLHRDLLLVSFACPLNEVEVTLRTG